ncbi:hypothetical protein CFOL_v3_28885, partial [Cephalotus follicularis]
NQYHFIQGHFLISSLKLTFLSHFPRSPSTTTSSLHHPTFFTAPSTYNHPGQPLLSSPLPSAVRSSSRQPLVSSPSTTHSSFSLLSTQGVSIFTHKVAAPSFSKAR